MGNINITAKPWEKPAATGGQGPTGDHGDQGSPGESQYNKGNCKWYCTKAPGNGKTGHAPTKTGKTGGQGVKGRPSAAGTVRLGVLTGDVSVLIGGADGQKGGKGGPGGAGGPGGPPGAQPKLSSGQTCSPTPQQGPQGKGGQGGDGGPGGPGGDSGFVRIFYTPDAGNKYTVNVTTTGVGGGGGGEPGDPGPGVGNLGGGNVGKPDGKTGPTPRFSISKT